MDPLPPLPEFLRRAPQEAWSREAAIGNRQPPAPFGRQAGSPKPFDFRAALRRARRARARRNARRLATWKAAKAAALGMTVPDLEELLRARRQARRKRRGRRA